MKNLLLLILILIVSCKENLPTVPTQNDININDSYTNSIPPVVDKPESSLPMTPILKLVDFKIINDFNREPYKLNYQQSRVYSGSNTKIKYKTSLGKRDPMGYYRINWGKEDIRNAFWIRLSYTNKEGNLVQTGYTKFNRYDFFIPGFIYIKEGSSPDAYYFYIHPDDFYLFLKEKYHYELGLPGYTNVVVELYAILTNAYTYDYVPWSDYYYTKFVFTN